VIGFFVYLYFDMP